MDGLREHPTDFDLPSAEPAPTQPDVSDAIGTDERRMHVRAYNYWASLLDGRDYPSIEDLEPSEVQEFAPHSVLLDFTCGRDNPATPYIGAAVREECGLDESVKTIDDVPSRSLLSRLTDHYLQIIANRAPIGFEAEFENQRGENICYRGILMPLSSDGDTIDFIYGVINWKTVGLASTAPAAEPAPPAWDSEDDLLLDEPVEEEGIEIPMVEPDPLAHAPTFEPLAIADPEPIAEDAHVHLSWEDGPAADEGQAGVDDIIVSEDAGLADRLWAARESAEAAKSEDGRSRAALYRALSFAYDFAIAAVANPEDYSELLEDSGVKAQARAPMTPIVKLVFGIDYDKARLTEFAAALSFADRQKIGLGCFKDFIETYPGCLKGLVAAERNARRPDSKPDTRGEKARTKLRSAPAISLGDIPGDEEFAVIVTRRSADGSHEPIAIVEDEALIERAIRRAA